MLPLFLLQQVYVFNLQQEVIFCRIYFLDFLRNYAPIFIVKKDGKPVGNMIDPLGTYSVGSGIRSNVVWKTLEVKWSTNIKIYLFTKN